MTSRSRIAPALGAAALAALVAYAPAASADRVAFSVSVGGPGYALAIGSPGGFYGAYHAPPVAIVPPPRAYHPYRYRPHYAPVVVPAPVYRTYYRPYYAPVVVAPQVVVHPHPAPRFYYRY